MLRNITREGDAWTDKDRVARLFKIAAIMLPLEHESLHRAYVKTLPLGHRASSKTSVLSKGTSRLVRNARQ